MDLLSPAQRQIVDCSHEHGHLLVLAAPGSGKTRTITERISRLLTRRVIEPEQVLVMSFTIKAAADLRSRLHAQGQSVWAGTFHSICDRLLRDHGHTIGWEQPYTIYDTLQQEAHLRHAAELLNYPVNSPHDFKNLRDCISSRKRQGIGAGEQRFTAPWDAPLVLGVDCCYRQLLADQHALDYDDLILKGVQLLQSDDETALLIRNRFRYLFVDEFHDVSPEQYELIRLLAPPHSRDQHVMTVADTNQSIYSFRDANAPEMIASYTRDYHPRRFRLEENYRSAGNLVRAAQSLITAGGATARTVVVHADHHPIDYCSCASDEAEAAHLARQIERARATGRYTYGDIAVLYRTHARANKAEEALLQHNIPLTRIQPNRFFDQPDVQAALRYLALIAALHDDDFEPALNWPRVLVDELTMLHLRRVAHAAGLSVSQLARQLDDYVDHLSPLTRVTIQTFLSTVAAELLPVAAEPIAVVVAKLLTVLAQRRSPIPAARRADATAVLDLLARPLLAPLNLLYAAITARRPLTLLHDGTVDSTAATTILEHVMVHYLRHPVSVELGPTPTDPFAFSVSLGKLLPFGQDGLALQVRDALTIRFSLSTQAWRLGQMLLMRYETLRHDTFVFYDVETTGVHVPTAELLEIAALKLTAGQPQAHPFHSMVRPHGPIPSDATRIHNIHWPDVCAAPTPATILPQFIEFIGDATLVGHNLEQFDHPLLCRLIRTLGLPLPTNPTLDTCALAHRLLPYASHKLEDLAHHFGISAPQTHRAPDDVQLNAQVFEHLLDLLAHEKELDVLDEALPLVALGTHAAGIPAEGENELLAIAGARASQAGLGVQLAARLTTLVAQPQQLLDAEHWLSTLPTAAPADDLQWTAMHDRWQSLIDHYCRITDDLSLPAFLHYAALAAPIDYQPNDQGRVAMMTIHTAKGREWPLVFLIGAEDDLLPIWSCKTLAELEEERRVLYVAITRAKQRLC
ncbi:MAG: UvrD-helicase domain-containing protein, partial [Herpetosiphonaceae bacterium]|nr:UvrD-helicase domain-containing protein [Herpetosiphonaceae bacterium]